MMNPTETGYSDLEAELMQDKDDPTCYRVEAFDSDGACELTLFSGPNALERAIVFAGTVYASWRDPQGLSGY